MSSYWSEADSYCWPQSSVLRNRLGLRSADELERAERLLIRARSVSELPDGPLDQVHFQSLHRWLFGDIYEWAGQFRTVRLAKGRSVFCFPEHIEACLADVFGQLAKRRAAALDTQEQAADLAAWLLCELNLIHAFRDGNGRTQALFASMVLLQRGWLLDLGQLNAADFLKAMIRSFQATDHSPLIGLLTPCLSRRL